VMLAAAIAVVAVPFLVACVQLLAHHGPIYLGGDFALVDVDVRAALRWQQLLGPYDRYGWHHPGPALAYILATVDRVVGTGPVGDCVGVASINAAAAVGSVILVHRRAGDLAGMWASAAIAVLCLTVGPPNLLAPWGPDVLALPAIFLGVLCADAGRRNLVSLLGAFLVGTFLVQTQLATLPIALGMIIAALVLAPIHTWKRPRPVAAKRDIFTISALSVLLAASWLPPVLEQIRHIGQASRPVVVSALHPLLPQVDPSQGNFVAIWHFFRSPHPGHSLTSAFSVLVPEPVVLVLLLVVIAAAVVCGRRVSGGLGADLGIVTLVAAAATLVAVTRIIGLIQGFDLTWDKAVPVLATIAIGVSLLALLQAFAEENGAVTTPVGVSRQRLAERLSSASMVAVVAIATAVGASFLIRIATFQINILSSPALSEAWPFVGPKLQGKKSVFVMPLDSDAYGLAAGIMDQLVASDVQATAPAAWGPEFGIGRVTTGNEQTEVIVVFGPYHGKLLLQLVPGPQHISYLVVGRH
jgi:hypothetical protein